MYWEINWKYEITFLTAARQATNTPSLATLADSHLQSSTSLFNPCSLTTSSARCGSLHNLWNHWQYKISPWTSCKDILRNLLQMIYLTLYLDMAMADFCKTRSAAEYWAKSSGRVGFDRPPLCWAVWPAVPSEFRLSILDVSGVAHCRNFRRTESPDWSTTSWRVSSLAAMLARTAAT